MVPVITFFWVASIMTGVIRFDLRRRFSYFLIIAILLIFSLLGDISGGFSGVMDELSKLLKYFSYLLIPVLCIQNSWQFELASRAIILSTLVVCLSAILDSLGLISLEFLEVADRTGDVRLQLSGVGGLGIDAIKRSAGLVGEFGTMALLTAFVLATLFFTRQEKIEQLRMASSRVWHLLVILFLLVGAVAAQSRNIIMVSFVVMSASVGLAYIVGKKGAVKIVAVIGLMLIGLLVITFVASYAMELYSIVLGEGTMKASGDARISQYTWALNLVKGNYSFGVDQLTAQRNAEAFILIHNLWLYQLVTTGIFGLVPLLILFIKISVDTYKLTKLNYLKQRAKNMFGLSLAIPLAVSFYAAQGALIFWFLLGCLIAFNVTAREKPRAPQTANMAKEVG
jgi:hypothetical protein